MGADCALYLLVPGTVWKGVALTFFGGVLRTAVDNILHPVPVGGDTCLSAYLLLIAMLSGTVKFGLDGVLIGPSSQRCSWPEPV